MRGGRGFPVGLMVLVTTVGGNLSAHAVTGAFTYQGQLRISGALVTDTCDFRFRLFDEADAGTQVGVAVDAPGIGVANGAFTTTLDFGAAAFPGAERWLEIAVRCPSGSGDFTSLSPRQQVTSAPYALFSAATASAPWTGLTGIPPGFADAVDDDTTYSAGTGVSLSGTQFSVASTYRLPQSCASGQVPKWNGAAWACAGDDSGIYTAGTGLSLDSFAFSLSPGYRLPQSCGASQVAKWSGSSWLCGADNDTTYTGGPGVAVNGTQVSVQFAGSGSASTVARSDHTHYVRTIVVSPVPGNPVASGTALQDALTSIVGAGSDNAFLLKLEPGTYDLGASSLSMQPYVDIEGSGLVVTKITASGSSGADRGTLIGADNAEIRFVTVENTGGDSAAVAIYNDGVSPRVADVAAIASDGVDSNYAIYSSGSLSSPTLARVVALAFRGSAAYGIYNDGASPNISESTAAAIDAVTNYGVYDQTAFPSMSNVTARTVGGNVGYGVYNMSSSPTMFSMQVDCSAGTVAYGVYNTGASSPRILRTSIDALVGGAGQAAYALYNVGASNPAVTGVTAQASGGAQANYGTYNQGSFPLLADSTLGAAGGAASYGAYNDSSAPVLRNVTLTAEGGSSNYGMFNTASAGSYVITVDQSRLVGSTHTVHNDAEFTTRIGASKLDGGPVDGGGTVKCAGVYDESYDFAPGPTCP